MMAVPTKAMRRLSEGQVRCRPVVVIVGPTAVGKSRVAVEVAKAFETEVLTADSRQVYRGMDIGTDKPVLEERQGIPHRLIDLVNPDEPFNTGLYRSQAVEEIDRLYRDSRLPLVVGGTGLYVRTLLKGLCAAPPADPALREALRQEMQGQGHDALYAKLVAIDPMTAARLHPRDESKVIRALEVYQLSGRRMSEFQQEHGFAERPFSALVIGLNRDREVLYRRIEARIDWQLAHGLIEETAQLLAQGYQRDSAAMKGLGYRQVAEHLAGEYDRVEMVRRFKRDTRHFSKRQMTWFRKEPGIQWLTIEESDSVQHTAALAIGQVERFLTTLGGEI
ncbi:MAG: tRNA (adenosine(37)-N6)-dimethylallyltransferase MiaA [Nitrospirae bacterium]|nr:tRNA (adenosine(37)-N6)-dimethylallyltransferase MiaA [Nitrospirota bacterium]